MVFDPPFPTFIRVLLIATHPGWRLAMRKNRLVGGFFLLVLFMATLAASAYGEVGNRPAQGKVAPGIRMAEGSLPRAMQLVAAGAAARSRENVERVGQIGSSTYAMGVQENSNYIGVGPRLAVLDVLEMNKKWSGAQGVKEEHTLAAIRREDHQQLRRHTGGWTPASPGMIGGQVWDVAISPDFANDQTVFAVTTKGGVFKTTNGGNAWTPVNTGLSSTNVRAIGLSPQFASDKVVYVGTWGAGVFRSDDAGASWDPLNNGLTTLDINTLAISPDFPTDPTLFVGTSAGVFVSIDGGATWSFVNGIGTLNVEQIALSPHFSTDRTLFVATSFGLFRSTDGGTTWHKVLNVPVWSVMVSPLFSADHTVFAGSTYLYLSTDGGSTWQQVSEVFDTVLDIEASPTYGTDQILYSATLSGVFISRDGGGTWQKIFSKDSRSLGISPNFAHDAIVFLVSITEGMYKSTDGGMTWNFANNGLLRLTVQDIAISPNYKADHTLYVATQQSGVFRSTDGGLTWYTVNNGIVNNNVEALAISPAFASDSTLFAGTDVPGGLFKSTDRGNTWTQIVASPVKSISLPPTYPVDSTIFCGGLGIYISRDDGATWSTADPIGLVFDFAFSPEYAADGTVFAAYDGGVSKSQDKGHTWQLHRISGMVYALGISPAYPQDKTIFAGTLGGGVYKSTDGGVTWVAKGLDNLFVRDILLSPDFPSDHTLYVATDAGVFRSTDGGETWGRMGLDTFQIWALGYLPPASPPYLLAGTRDEGLWRYALPLCYDFVAPSGIGEEDVVYVAQRWRMKTGEPGWESRLDINGDGIINLIDVLTIASQVGGRCP